MADQYTRGEMDISHHKATFSGVMNVSVFSALIISVAVLYLTLVFAAGMSWMSSLIASAIVGAIGGVVLKQGALYWVCLGVMAVITVISGLLVGMLG